jgi:hypothetical protein
MLRPGSPQFQVYGGGGGRDMVEDGKRDCVLTRNDTFTDTW